MVPRSRQAMHGGGVEPVDPKWVTIFTLLQKPAKSTHWNCYTGNRDKPPARGQDHKSHHVGGFFSCSKTGAEMSEDCRRQAPAIRKSLCWTNLAISPLDGRLYPTGGHLNR